MLKQKYLYRKIRKRGKDDYIPYNKKVKKNLDLFSDLPTHQSVHKKYRDGIDTTPLDKFIKSKIGENWNDVYSELLTKIEPKFRYYIDNSLEWIVQIPIYDEDLIPRSRYGDVLGYRIFIDMNNILTFKSKEELIFNAKRTVRLEKLKKILERNENEEKKGDDDERLCES